MHALTKLHNASVFFFLGRIMSCMNNVQILCYPVEFLTHVQEVLLHTCNNCSIDCSSRLLAAVVRMLTQMFLSATMTV